MQNTLHFNNGNGTFSETAFLSGIAATEWSWNPIIGDFDNDSFKDIYITNGILGATNDMDYINFISNKNIQKQLASEKSERNLILSKQIPKKKVKNYFYKNNGDKTFSNITSKWVSHGSSYSNGGVSVDLDNDGDLDLVVNNINENAYILENRSNETSKNKYLKIKFRGSKNNILGIGARVKTYVNEKILTEENYTTKGYLSSVESKIHFGLGNCKIIDSIQIIWPNDKLQTLKKIEPNQEIEVAIEDANEYFLYKKTIKNQVLLSNVDSILNFKHKDTRSLEFDREPLIPFANTNLGPDIAIEDINNDGLQDLFICGGKAQASKLFIQNKLRKFISFQDTLFDKYIINEDVNAKFIDVNGDEYKDLLVVSGGNEFKRGKALKPRLYINKKGKFVEDKNQFKDIEVNASKIKNVDIDNDGDQDISIISNLVPWEFGKTPRQYIFENNGSGKFTEVTQQWCPDFKNIGNVQDIVWIDINQDNYKDAVVVGYWMPVSIFLNNGENLILQSNNSLEKN